MTALNNHAKSYGKNEGAFPPNQTRCIEIAQAPSYKSVSVKLTALYGVSYLQIFDVSEVADGDAKKATLVDVRSSYSPKLYRGKRIVLQFTVDASALTSGVRIVYWS